jgi:sugar (pentulose or hexulose) kinase
MKSVGIQFLVADLGTSSIKVAVFNRKGQILAMHSCVLKRHHPHPGWSEQDPEEWWKGFCDCCQIVLADTKVDLSKLKGIAVCGQMHGPVPIDADGQVLLNRIQLWDDKRCIAQINEFQKKPNASELQKLVANPPATSWTAFKAAWIRDCQPSIYSKTFCFLTPKDFINFRLSGQFCTDRTEASGSFLINAKTGVYSPELADALDLDLSKFPRIHPSEEVIGSITRKAAEQTGIPHELPVVAGGGDSMVAMLGSGVIEPGKGLDLTGTSTLIGLCSERPLLHPHISNLYSAAGYWSPCICIDTGGDSIHWVNQILGKSDQESEEIDRILSNVPPGSEGLFYLPYLSGERLSGTYHSRAQFFGLSLIHTREFIYRAVAEGLAMAGERNLQKLQQAGAELKELIVSGGGAQGKNWLQIKASVYGITLVVTECTESGLLGAVILAGTGTGYFNDVKEGASKLVCIKERIYPDSEIQEKYKKRQEFFNRIYDQNLMMSNELYKMINKETA